MSKRNLLKGRMVEFGYNIGSFARILGISRQSLGKRLNGKSDFTAAEIVEACKVLEIDATDIDFYFFAGKVSNLGKKQNI